TLIAYFYFLSTLRCNDQDMNFQSKLPDVGTTIFTVMSQLSVDHNAINLGQGFPDFNPDETLLDLVSRAMKEGHNQYPPMAGIPALRQAISSKVESLYGHRYDFATEITVTSGASEALMASILAFVREGDERSEEHTSELQSRENLVCRLLLEKKKK